MDKSPACLIGADGKHFIFSADRPTRIGRSADNDIVISDKSVSRYHATISLENGRYVVRDLESQNGTWVSGRRVGSVQLADGDRIRFGDAELALSNPERIAHSAPTDMPSTVKGEPPANTPWWRLRSVQAGAVAAAVGGLALALAQRHPRQEQGNQAIALASLTAGRANFDLPNASPDFVGDWQGAALASFRSPPTFGSESNECGATFYLVDKQVVMSIASYGTADMKVTDMKAAGIDANHVIVEEEALVRDSIGQTWRDHQKVEFALVSSDSLDCTITDNYYRDSAQEATGKVVYQGSLRRISRAEAEKQVEEMKERGMTEKAKVDAPISKK
jgi:pSer/pThr/pTyr-binding forkhead associated (FHA) protein